MKICRQCNLDYTDDKKFCRKCGSPLTINLGVNPKIGAQKSILETKVNNDPLNISLLLEFANFLIQIKEFDQALFYLHKVLVIDEERTEASRLLLECYIEQKNYHEALVIGNELMDKASDDILLNTLMAELYFEIKDSKKSDVFLDKALALKPKDLKTLISLSNLLLQRKDEKRADLLLEKIYEIDPTYPYAKFAIAKKLFLNKDFENARYLLENLENELTFQDKKDKTLLMRTISQIKSGSELDKLSRTILDFQLDSFEQTEDPFQLEMVSIIYLFQINKQFDNWSFEQLSDTAEKADKLSQDGDMLEIKAELNAQIAAQYLKSNRFSDAKHHIAQARELRPDHEGYADFECELDALSKKKKKHTLIRNWTTISGLALIAIGFYLYTQFKQEDSWKNAKNANTFESYETYLNKYKTGKHNEEAIRLQEDALWQETQANNSIESVSRYFAKTKVIKYKYAAQALNESLYWKQANTLNTIDAFQNYVDSIGTFDANHYQIAMNRLESFKFAYPTIERIQNDLLGHNIGNWSFDELREFISSKILFRTIIDEQLNIGIKFRLKSFNSGTEYDSEVLVIYSKGSDGWYFSEVRCISYEESKI